jgi:hypothetical protein
MKNARNRLRSKSCRLDFVFIEPRSNFGHSVTKRRTFRSAFQGVC